MRYIPFLILLFATGLTAQTAEKTEKWRKQPITLKTNPLEWINYYVFSATLQADLPLAKRWGAELGAGMVYNSTRHARYDGEKYQGPRLLAGLKFFVLQDTDFNFYLKLGGKAMRLQHAEYQLVARQGWQYQEEMRVERDITVFASTFGFGAQFFMGNRQRFFMEPCFGAGLRWKYISDSNLPPDGQIIEPLRGIFTLSNAPGWHKLPELSLALKVGWRL